MASENSILDSIYLKVSTIEPILTSCVETATWSDIYNYLQKNFPDITKSDVKVHLIYLINGSYIKYGERNNLYSVSQKGLDLIDFIYSKKIRTKTDYANLMIRTEC